jgi:hypothetical protein
MVIEYGSASIETQGGPWGLYHEQASIPCVPNDWNSTHIPQFGRCERS